MTPPQHTEKPSYAPEVQAREGMSAGAGVALVGVCFSAVVLTIFLCLLFFTDHIVPGTVGAIEKYSNEHDSGPDILLYALIPFSPIIAAYFLGKAIIKRG